MWDYSDVYKKDQYAFSYVTLHEWTYKKFKGKKMKDFLDANGYKKIAICCLSSLGNVFYEECVAEGVDIAYIIDKNPKMLPKNLNDIPVVTMDEVSQQEEVDAIVICHVYYYNKIADELVNKGISESKMLSLNDIVFTL